MFTQAASCALYYRKMILCSWKLPSSVCVGSRLGQAWKKANTLPNQNTEFDKRLKKSISKQKHNARKSRLGEHGPLKG